jgi:4-diphosphocytidyl-2-C-methyl-D-erythritol kinase
MGVHLQKNIPVGAGLGGGSSDAAAALWGGWLLWSGKKKKPATVPPVLLACAKKLGADVTFFLKGGTAWGEGIGEKLSTVGGCSRHWMVLIYPNVHVSTKDAYGLLDKFRERFNNKSDRRAPPKAQVIEYLRSIRRPQFVYPNGPYNSFQSVILSEYPEVAEARQELSRLGCAPVMMTGSGSTVFGVCKDKAEAESIQRELTSRPWKTFVVYTCP